MSMLHTAWSKKGDTSFYFCNKFGEMYTNFNSGVECDWRRLQLHHHSRSPFLELCITFEQAKTFLYHLWKNATMATVLCCFIVSLTYITWWNLYQHVQTTFFYSLIYTAYKRISTTAVVYKLHICTHAWPTEQHTVVDQWNKCVT